jgi:arylsulfatase A-like enzyme
MQSVGRNPIYVLTGDNGMSWGRDGFSMKNVPQSTALPLYISGPGITAGSTKALVANIDLSPTLADLAGTTMPKADGVSFAPVLLGQSTTARNWLFEDHPLGGNANGNGLTKTGPWWGIRTADGWHLVEWPKWRGEALYFYPDDPWEQNNLASQYPEIVAQLKAHKPY